MMPLPGSFPTARRPTRGALSIFGIYAGMPYDYVRKVTVLVDLSPGNRRSLGSIEPQ
ncbi:MAG: hypothetical protein CM1200mP29_15770 [Verrucomicrobiota bacterium]|nr:MAG: hypothetical protein CM1200mP29_15770 [Verrucomicrobiota bacterium]